MNSIGAQMWLRTYSSNSLSIHIKHLSIAYTKCVGAMPTWGSYMSIPAYLQCDVQQVRLQGIHPYYLLYGKHPVFAFDLANQAWDTLDWDQVQTTLAHNTWLEGQNRNKGTLVDRPWFDAGIIMSASNLYSSHSFSNNLSAALTCRSRSEKDFQISFFLSN